MRTAAALALAALAAASGRSQEPTRVQSASHETMRPEIVGQHGIVAAGRHYAVEAGMRLLRDGGNATDAGVASVFAAAVVEISHFGFGGESPTMIYDAKTGRVVVISGQGPAPKAATPALFATDGKVPGNGPLGATVPAVMDAMALALEHYGTKSLAQTMAPAIELADGFPMYDFLRGFLLRERERSSQWEWSAKTYYPGGRVPDVGEIFRQPNLATTLRTIVAAEAAALKAGRDRRAAIRAGAVLAAGIAMLGFLIAAASLAGLDDAALCARRGRRSAAGRHGDAGADRRARRQLRRLQCPRHDARAGDRPQRPAVPDARPGFRPARFRAVQRPHFCREPVRATPGSQTG